MSRFVCQQCGYVSPQWLGKCPECGAWNSLVETIEESASSRLRGSRKSKAGRREALKPQKLGEIKNDTQKRVSSGFSELDRVLGGGIVDGGVTLLAGDPGVGKSTLLLQTALNLSKSNKNDNHNVLYISGEESAGQIKMRALRLAKPDSGQTPNDTLYLLSQTLVENLVDAIGELKPDLVIVDSIQTMESENLTGAAGSVGQVRECASQLINLAKNTGIAIFLVGHVTKEGTVAGPMVLSHMVDTVLFFEGEKFKNLRIIRCLKNRFGPVDEVGIFAITQEGIAEVKNPSQVFLAGDGLSTRKVAGSVIVASSQGSRPMLVEIQALVVPTKLAVPRRIVSGVDPRRVELLCAVLQKTCRLPLDRFDVFVAGGIQLREPGVDLAVSLAIFSSFKNKPFPKTVAVAEVGLLGELRPVEDLKKRLIEAQKLGFTNFITAEKYTHITEICKI
ncbi:DNA repair protein RadA [Candidatus Microgenomates bacterium]|nr:DNA repair protein RadA [Candidatus Microgenomates bacterium]